jgi:muconolactone D-isomerase
MLFLVDIVAELTPDLRDPASEQGQALMAGELERGVQLHRAGVIQRIWRVPGELRNVGVWEATDATELHDQLASLPMFPWIRASVTPLAIHPVERDSDGPGPDEENDSL